MSAIDPTNNTGLIIDDFINYAISHLSTIGGVINTTSLYPPLQTPGPAVIFKEVWLSGCLLNGKDLLAEWALRPVASLVSDRQFLLTTWVRAYHCPAHN